MDLKSIIKKIYVSDGKYSSFNETTIKVIEINNAPKIETAGVKTEVMKNKKGNAVAYRIEFSTEKMEIKILETLSLVLT